MLPHSDIVISITHHYVSSLITGFGESREGEEPSGHSIGRQLVRGGALEPNHALRLLVAVSHVVRVVATM